MKILKYVPAALMTLWSVSVLIRSENKLRSLNFLEDQMETDHADMVREHLNWRKATEPKQTQPDRSWLQNQEPEWIKRARAAAEGL